MNKKYKLISFFRKYYDYFLFKKNKTTSFDSIRHLYSIYTPKDAINFLYKLVEYGYDSDAIIEHLVYLYSIKPPNRNHFYRISYLYKSVLNTNSEEEYALATIWICANQSIIYNRILL